MSKVSINFKTVMKFDRRARAYSFYLSEFFIFMSRTLSCGDLLRIYFFIPRFQYIHLIISSSSLPCILRTNLMASSQLAL